MARYGVGKVRCKVVKARYEVVKARYKAVKARERESSLLTTYWSEST